MNKIYILLFSFLLSSFSFSQNKKIDSLKNILKAAKNDSVKIDIMNSIAGKYWGVQWDSAKHYTTKSFELAKKINSTNGVAIGYINLAVYEDIAGNFGKSKQIFDKAFEVLQKSGSDKNFASYYYNLGNHYLDSGNLKTALATYKTAITYYEKLKRPTSIAGIKNNIAIIQTESNDYFNSNKTYFDLLQYYKTTQDFRKEGSALLNIALNFIKMNEYGKSIEFSNRALGLGTKNNLNEIIGSANNGLASAYGELKDFAKCEYHLREAIKYFEKASYLNGILNAKINLAELKVKQKKLYEAEQIIDEVLKSNLKNSNNYIQSNMIKGHVLFENKKHREADRYLKEAYNTSKQTKKYNNLDKILQIYLQNSLKLKNPNIERQFLEYDSIMANKNNLNNKNMFFVLDTRYRVGEKEIEIKEHKKTIYLDRIKIQKEKEGKTNAYLVLGFLSVLSGGGFLYFRNRKKREDLQKQNNQLSLQKSLNEMQLQNLNKQLNPHEIKNLLAGFSLEMQHKAPETYQNMVKLFNLTKASLYNDSLTEKLEDQIKQAEDFIALEKQILFEPIDFSIEKNISGNVEIPRLLIKNLLENSVKHGIKGKENGGSILLKIFEKENYINIEVDDTGKGRKMAISKDSGIGTSTYIKLFETLNKTNEKKASFEILDKEIGTKVVVKIPKNYNYS